VLAAQSASSTPRTRRRMKRQPRTKIILPRNPNQSPIPPIQSPTTRPCSPQQISRRYSSTLHPMRCSLL
jgi:hypothetical protein